LADDGDNMGTATLCCCGSLSASAGRCLELFFQNVINDLLLLLLTEATFVVDDDADPAAADPAVLALALKLPPALPLGVLLKLMFRKNL